jgi:N-formylglutamate amidohydrolase
MHIPHERIGGFRHQHCVIAAGKLTPSKEKPNRVTEIHSPLHSPFQQTHSRRFSKFVNELLGAEHSFGISETALMLGNI